MPLTKVTSAVLNDAAVTSAKLDTNIAIDGNLTVDTNTLFVDSANNKVGIGTTSPSGKLHVSTGNDSNSGNIEFVIGGTAGTNARSGRIIKNTSSPYEMTIRASDFDTGSNLILNDTGGVVTISSSRLEIPNVNATNEIQLTGTEYSNIYSQTTSGFDIGTNSSSGTSYFRLLTENTERMRIDSSGRVGIGVTPNPWSSPNFTVLQLGVGASIAGRGTAGTGDKIYISANTYYDGATWRYIETNPASSYYQDNGKHVWRTAVNGSAGVPTTFSERMSIQNNGRVLIGTTTEIGTVNERLQVKNNNAGDRGIAVGNSDGDSNTGAITFYNSNGIVGTIATSGSATSYLTSSDYRLKENVVPMEGALDRVDALKPSRFNFIADADKTVDGFLAHEIAEVVPEAISGEKDAVEDYEVTPAVLDDEGNVIEEAVMGTRPVYQGIDQSKLVPLLVGAIQELKAEIETLKSQINN